MGNQTSQGNEKFGEPVENGVTVTVTKTKAEFPFAARDGLCCCAVGNKVYVFGGVIQGEPGEVTEANDLLVLEAESQTWSKAVSKGDVPRPCSAASLQSVGDKLYLFGGLSHEVGWLDTLHVYDIGSQQWKLVDGKGVYPSARDKLTAAVIGTSIYYFGGFGPTSQEEELTEDSEEEGEFPDQEAALFGWFNDLYIFDTVTNTWSQPMQLNLGVPTPRAAHAMCPVGKNLVIFGGKDAEGRQNDLHIFNVDTRKWDTEVKVRGRQPYPRSFHSSTAVGNRVVIMGGRNKINQHLADLHILDTERKEWLQPSVQGDLPSGRGLHAAVVSGEHLVIFGGSANIDPETNQCQDIFKDTYFIKTDDILKGSSSGQGSESPKKAKINGTNGV